MNTSHTPVVTPSRSLGHSFHTYTLVCYRPNGVDTCRNCVMGRSDSDFELHVFQSPEDAAAKWVAKLREDAKSEREYCSWEVSLLIDGKSDWYDEDDAALSMESAFDQVTALVRLAQAGDAENDRIERMLKEGAAKAEASAVAERVAQAQQARMREKYLRLRAIFEAEPQN